MSLFDRMLVTLWKYGVHGGFLTILQVALPTVFLVGSERFWTCVCLRMRAGNTGRRVWWTNSTRCSALASSPSSASSRATSLTFIWQCPRSRQRASTTASWSSCGRHTGRSWSKVGRRVSPPKRRVSGTRPEGEKESAITVSPCPESLLFVLIISLKQESGCFLLLWSESESSKGPWYCLSFFFFLFTCEMFSNPEVCLIQWCFILLAYHVQQRIQGKPQMWARYHF